MIQALRHYLTPDFKWISTDQHSDSPPELAGKLLLQHEVPPQERVHLTPVSSIETYFWGHRCRRCGNKKSYLFARMPHSECQKDCLYCRNCLMMGRVMECQPLYIGSDITWPTYEEPCQWDGQLTPYQQQASDRIETLVKQGDGELLVWAVCGAGKTEMLFPGLTGALQTGKRICLATPRTDVVRELLPRFQKAFPTVTIQALYGDSPDKSGAASLIIATTHQLFRFAHAFDVMIIDEIDAFPYHNDPSLHFASHRAAKPDAARIYLTATPRTQQHKRIKAKTLPVVFIPKRFHGHPLPIPKLKLCPTLNRQLKHNQLPSSIKGQIRTQKETSRQLLIFISSIERAEQTANLLHNSGYSVQSVHASDPDRAEKINAFRNQEYRILVTTTILERGVTFPSVDVYVIDAGHQVFDEAALVQIAGRAGRSPNDPTGDVVFYHNGKTNAMLHAYHQIAKMNHLSAKS